MTMHISTAASSSLQLPHSHLWPSIRASAPALRSELPSLDVHLFAPALRALALPAPALRVTVAEAITIRLITLE